MTNNPNDSPRLFWLNTYGGPPILMAERLLPVWRGYSDTDLDPLDTSHDYGRACAVDGLNGTISVGDGFGLVLVEPWVTAWFPPFLVQWICADSEDIVLKHLKAIQSQPPGDAETQLVVDGDLVLFDSVIQGVEYDHHGSIRIHLLPGRYSVASSLFKAPDGTQLILHRLYGGQDGTAIATPAGLQ